VRHTAVVRTQEHPQLVPTQGSIESQTYRTYSSTVPDHQSGVKAGIGPRLMGAGQVDSTSNNDQVSKMSIRTKAEKLPAPVRMSSKFIKSTRAKMVN
jgi:hypothetical protein